MAGVDAALQERLRLRYASLTAARENATPAPAELAQAYGEVGKLLIAAEFFAEAEPFLLNAQALSPVERAWPYYLGHAYRLRNDTARAMTAFETALRLRGDDLATLVWLGVVRMDAGQLAEARPILERAVSLYPQSAAARAALGRALMTAGSARQAIEQFNAALAADPAAARIHYLLGMAYRSAGDAGQADRHLRLWESAQTPADALRGNQPFPADPLMEEISSLLQTAVAYQASGTKAIDAGKLPEAIAIFRKGLAVAPSDPALHQNLATALYLAGEAEAARGEYEAALRLSPGYARAHFGLGILAETRGDDEEALRRLTDAVKHDPAMVDARFGLAETLRRVGRAEAALPHYEQIFTADSSASQARFGYAMALVRLGRFADARAALETAVRQHPDQPGLPHALARLLAAAPDDGVRDGARALAITNGLIRQYGKSPVVVETLAMALAETGRYAEAAALQREAIAAAKTPGAALRENLRLYETGRPSRTPWAEDDPIFRPRH